MKTSNTRAGKFRPVIGKIVMALVFALLIGGMTIAPALARDGRYYGGRGHGYYRGGYGYYGGPAYGYGYYPPVYAPPPVYYGPPGYPYPSPGVTLVFPFHIR